MSWDADTQAGPTPKKPSKALVIESLRHTAAHDFALDPWRSMDVFQEHTVAGPKSYSTWDGSFVCIDIPLVPVFQPSKIIQDFDKEWVWP